MINELRDRVTFIAPQRMQNTSGGYVTTHADQFSAWAHIRYLRGGETIQAARLKGRQPIVLTIRRRDGIGTDWRVRDERTAQVYAITSPPVLTDDRAYYEFMCESGGET